VDELHDIVLCIGKEVHTLFLKLKIAVDVVGGELGIPAA